MLDDGLIAAVQHFLTETQGVFHDDLQQRHIHGQPAGRC